MMNALEIFNHFQKGGKRNIGTAGAYSIFKLKPISSRGSN